MNVLSEVMTFTIDISVLLCGCFQQEMDFDSAKQNGAFAYDYIPKPQKSIVIMPLWWLILCINLNGPWYLDIWSNSSQFVAVKVFLAVSNI